MKLKISRNSLEVVPENEQDDAFLEDTLGLKKDGDIPFCAMVIKTSFDGTKHIEIKKSEVKNETKSKEK